MEKVAADDDEIYIFTDGITLQNIDPGIEKISRAFGQVVSRTS